MRDRLRKQIGATVLACATATAVTAAALVPPAAQTPEPSPSARVATVRFVIQDGWKFPSTGIIVSTQIDRGVMHAWPVRGYTREQTRFTEEIARMLGPDVKALHPARYLDCPGGDRGPCWAKGETAVLEVGEMLNDGPDASIYLYSPGAKAGEPPSVTSAVVNLERRGSGWVGIGYGMGPTTRTRKR